MKTALIFFFAVLSEVIATTSLKFSEGFTKLLPSLIVVVGYGLSFYLLAISLKTMPIGIAPAAAAASGQRTIQPKIRPTLRPLESP